MRWVDVVRSVGLLVGVSVGAWMAVRRRLLRHYESRGAFGPQSAVAPPVARFPPTRWWKQRLRAAGVIVALPDGREWLDARALTVNRALRRRRALAVALLLVALLLLFAGLAARRG